MPRPFRQVLLLGMLLASCSIESVEAPPRTVVLVVVDTLRADGFGVHGSERPSSPALDARAGSMRVFDHAWSTSSWTLPSMASIYTGELPSGHHAGQILAGTKSKGRRAFGRLDAESRPLAEVLGQHGFQTAAVVNNAFLDPSFGLARGFEHYDHVAGTLARIRRADAMVDLALEWIDGVGEAPFFLVLHLFDPHTNYDAPPPFRGSFCGGVESQLSLPVADVEGLRTGAFDLAAADLEFLRGAYLEEVAFVDAQIERFLAGLQARSLFDDSLIVITADHGEELFEHGGFEHGHAMWEELLHVPLWVHGPGVRSGRTTAAVSLADVAPTILEAVGIRAPDGRFGVSLWRHLTEGEPVSARPLIAEGTFYGPEQWAILSGGHKLIRRAEGVSELFDLAQDPAESEDRLALNPELAQTLGAELTRQLERARVGRTAGQAHVDDDLSAGIEDLGYTSD